MCKVKAQMDDPEDAKISNSSQGQVYNMDLADHTDFADLTSVVLRVRVLGFRIGQNLNRRPYIRGLRVCVLGFHRDQILNREPKNTCVFGFQNLKSVDTKCL